MHKRKEGQGLGYEGFKSPPFKVISAAAETLGGEILWTSIRKQRRGPSFEIARQKFVFEREIHIRKEGQGPGYEGLMSPPLKVIYDVRRRNPLDIH